MKTIRSLSMLALLILAGCSSPSTLDSADTQPPPEQPPPALVDQLPPPPVGGAERSASLIGLTLKPGIDSAGDFGAVAYGPSTAELTPPPDTLAGVIYALPVNGFSYDMINFDIDFDDPAKLWLGIADYRGGAWSLRVASPGITSTAPPYPTAHAPDGNAYLAVLAWDDTTVVVNMVGVSPNIPTWQHHLIDDQDGIGVDADVALVGDFLYVAYDVYDTIDVEDIRLARATEPLPTESGHWDRTLITDLGDTQGLDLDVINSLPALIYSEG